MSFTVTRSQATTEEYHIPSQATLPLCPTLSLAIYTSKVFHAISLCRGRQAGRQMKSNKKEPKMCPEHAIEIGTKEQTFLMIHKEKGNTMKKLEEFV